VPKLVENMPTPSVDEDSMSDETEAAQHSAMRDAVERLAARAGETIVQWGPVEIDAVTVARFREALGLPARDDDATYVPAIVLAHIPRRSVEVHRDARPSEQVDQALGNPVNGGTQFEFLRPLHIGDRIHGRTTVHSARLRAGKAGPLAVVVKETVYSDATGANVARQQHTMIYRGQR
jgi:N-terminal half of MaoC dehydratase